MAGKLDGYLEEVGHYIAGDKCTDDILAEIRSHIYDRAQEEFGDTSDESIEKVLSGMEDPRDMAARYSQGQDIIAPYYRKHLMLYTAFLFLINLGVSIISLVLGGKGLHLIPFFQAAEDDFYTFLGGLPVTFFFYFGIVCMFLMVITKYRKVKPAWLILGNSGKEMGTPNLAGLAGRLFGFILVVAVLGFQDEIVKVITDAFPRISIYGLPDLLVNAFLAMAGIDLVVYAFRFLANTPVLEAAGAAAKLLIMAFIVRMPMGFETLTGLDSTLSTAIEMGIRAVCAIIVVITTIELMRWLLYSFQERYLK
ncbi:MAG TPA: hypothetical protein PLT03_03565 [Bacillota bacterium]|nr:hypothetical protein [Bacillota bacterium]HOG52932.1 hypothetical protein [Bacillota bacterium]